MHPPVKPVRREPAPGVFRLILPLPFPGLTKVNAYALAGDNELTLVDCGIFEPLPDRDESWQHLVGALDACELHAYDITRLVITHPHIDHYGLAGRVVEETGCVLYMHERSDSEIDAYGDPDAAVSRVRSMLQDHGVDPQDIDELSAFEDWRSYLTQAISPAVRVKDGDDLEVGGRSWKIVYTPGHSPSHICLWAENERLLISGDHLLGAITPHVDFRREADDDPLGEYLDALVKIEHLNPKIVLPGHGRPFEEGAARARAVARHHDRRLGSIVQVIRHEAHTASEISDEIFGTTLLNFGRRLALGETLAHLAYLRARGEVARDVSSEGAYVYKKAKRRPSSSDEE
ncbi:MAG: MBL fold metallo-hydrolase [Actinobacteria bacterium]|nr:MBL fold metallo-hydrolase [Actinomycetota bacterium]